MHALLDNFDQCGAKVGYFWWSLIKIMKITYNNIFIMFIVHFIIPFQVTFELNWNPPQCIDCTLLPPLWSSSTHHPGCAALISTLHTFLPSPSHFPARVYYWLQLEHLQSLRPHSIKVMLTKIPLHKAEQPTSAWILLKLAYAVVAAREKVCVRVQIKCVSMFLVALCLRWMIIVNTLHEI